MPHVLLVCTANICRSPVAAGLLRQLLDEKGMTDWVVSSAGTWAVDARPPSRFSVDVMQQRGLDIGDNVAQMISHDLVKRADLILCMEAGHAEALRAEFPRQARKIFLLAEMVGRRYSIGDPYGRPLEEYERMANDIEALLAEGFPKIIELAGAAARS